MMNRKNPGRRPSGAFIFADYKQNHATWPDREESLLAFISQRYGGRQHKRKNAYSSHSEDALTWSCFDCLAYLGPAARQAALAELWELAFDGTLLLPDSVRGGDIAIGRTYGTVEDTEVDISIVGPGALVFVEAKLYSPMSQANRPAKPHNQIGRKIRVGVREAVASGRDFYFILLDIAPPKKLRELCPGASLKEAQTARASGFAKKWLTAYWFQRYKRARGGSTKPLADLLAEDPPIHGANVAEVAQHMGWLTWADVFKVVLRAVIADRK